MPRGAESRTKTGKKKNVLPRSPKSCRTELKVEQKQEKKKKCSTAESEIDPRGARSRTKTEKKEKMFYRRVQNRAARR